MEASLPTFGTAASKPTLLETLCTEHVKLPTLTKVSPPLLPSETPCHALTVDRSDGATKLPMLSDEKVAGHEQLLSDRERPTISLVTPGSDESSGPFGVHSPRLDDVPTSSASLADPDERATSVRGRGRGRGRPPKYNTLAQRRAARTRQATESHRKSGWVAKLKNMRHIEYRHQRTYDRRKASARRMTPPPASHSDETN